MRWVGAACGPGAGGYGGSTAWSGRLRSCISRRGGGAESAVAVGAVAEYVTAEPGLVCSGPSVCGGSWSPGSVGRASGPGRSR